MTHIWRFQKWAGKISICYRIVIANTIVIIIEAVILAWLTYYFRQQNISLLIIISIVLAGILLCTLLNLTLVKSALRPLRQLEKFSIEIENPENFQNNLVLTNPDPDTCQIAETLINLIRQLESNNRKLRALSQQAINAQEEERRRIARWLHDDTGQALLSLMINLEHIEKKVPSDQHDLRLTIERAKNLSQKTLDELRVIIHGLRPSILDDLGLGPAIRWYARTKLEEAGISVTIQIPENKPDISPRLRTSLFRIAQEAINNIVRHSNAKNAIITLETKANEIFLSIEDDGQGFFAPPNSAEAIRRQQWGLVGIQERVELIDGEFNLTSEPGKGVLLEVYAPLQPEIEAQYA